ncbi:MAG: hypothetical protein ABFD80_13725 [Acidobacteriota bacterium]
MNETNDRHEMNDQNEANEKNKGHLLDLKLPVGWLFSAMGIVLGVYGLISKKEIYERSLGINVNLIWGVILFVFGASFLLVTFLKKKAAKRGRTSV